MTSKTKAAEEILSRSHADRIATAIISAARNPNSPSSLRMSAPLLERLDRIAGQQHRKRSNLIQHILWEYVFAEESSRR
ncbi:MAG TPA: hypothetical protein VE826_04175 [Dongiaceae bacterium]|nr:hypothetical protein [Dongiaceae bacterium]